MTWDLKYFDCGEYDVVRERLRDLTKAGIPYCPKYQHMFKAMTLTPLKKVKVFMCGQDPYPSQKHATGLAFSIPADISKPNWPPTLVNLFKEYEHDLHYPEPSNGDLSLWAKRGVLLWNCTPSCTAGHPGSHNWDEWKILTKEMVERVDVECNAVFIFLGRRAREFEKYVKNSPVIETSHPSPLGYKHGFEDSRIFSHANGLLCQWGQETVNWRLDDGTDH